jgi:hypothetical protein
MTIERQTYEIIRNQWKDCNKKFVIHHCSQCEYPCGYFWENNQLLFDAGCFCLLEKEKPRICSDDELMDWIKDNGAIVEKIFAEEKIFVN